MAPPATIVRPAAAAPPRRPEQVGRHRPPNLARAREGSEYGERCQIPLIFRAAAAAALRERGQRPYCQCCRFSDHGGDGSPSVSIEKLPAL
jgi:hypothetical protein